MDYLKDNIEEAERLRRRKERMEKMRQEKKRQMERRRRMKKMIPLAAVCLVMLSAALTSLALLKGKAREKDATQAVETVTSEENLSGENMQMESMASEESAQSSQAISGEGNVQTEVVQEESAQEESLTQGSLQNETPLGGEDYVIKPYAFQSTSNTVAIYNEEIISEYAILIDESTDTIVASKRAKERISPASMTKVLTVLVAAENITKEQLNDTFVMTREITDYGYINDCSGVGFLDGEEIPVKDLFYGTILPSGADAAVGLATYVAGSHEAFVEMMNDKLKELGLGETSHYTNCVGIYDEEHYSTVYDMAIIMKAAIQNEFCKEVLSEHNYTTAPTTEHPEGLNVSNWFLRRIEDKDTGGEVLCAKTGYVQQSKSCAVSYGVFGDSNPYICVTAGSTSSWRCIYDHVEIYNEYVLK